MTLSIWGPHCLLQSKFAKSLQPNNLSEPTMGRSLILRPWPFCESNECFALRLKQYCTDENVGGKAFREFWNVDSEFWLESLILMLDNIFYQSYFNSYPSTVLPSSIYCTSDTLLMNRKESAFPIKSCDVAQKQSRSSTQSQDGLWGKSLWRWEAGCPEIG